MFSKIIFAQKIDVLLLPIYKPALSARLIGPECVCACAVENKGAEGKEKIAKERKEERVCAC